MQTQRVGLTAFDQWGCFNLVLFVFVLQRPSWSLPSGRKLDFCPRDLVVSPACPGIFILAAFWLHFPYPSTAVIYEHDKTELTLQWVRKAGPTVNKEAFHWLWRNSVYRRPAVFIRKPLSPPCPSLGQFLLLVFPKKSAFLCYTAFVNF